MRNTHRQDIQDTPYISTICECITNRNIQYKTVIYFAFRINTITQITLYNIMNIRSRYDLFSKM